MTPKLRKAWSAALFAIANRCEKSGWSSHVILRDIAETLPKLMPVVVATESLTRLQMVTLPPSDVSGRAMADAALAAVREWTGQEEECMSRRAIHDLIDASKSLESWGKLK